MFRYSPHAEKRAEKCLRIARFGRTLGFLLVAAVAVAGIVTANSAAPKDELALSAGAKRALEEFGLSELAEPPLPPSVLTDETTSLSLDAYTLCLRGVYLMSRKQLAPARRLLEEAAKLCPNNYGIGISLAEIDARTLQDQPALKACDRLIREFPTRIESFELKARILEGEGRKDAAIAVYKEVLKRWPNCDSMVQRLLALAFESGDLDLTIEVCKNRLERQPKHFYTLYLLGYVCKLKAMKTNDASFYRESAKYLERALESRSAQTGKIYPQLAEVYEILDARDKALATLRRGVVADPADPEIRKAFERLASPDQKDEEILDAYRKMAEDYPSSPDIIQMYAGQLLARQKYRLARDQFERLLTLEPNNIKTLLDLGGLDLQDGDTSKAQQHFARAAQLAGDDAETYERIGTSYLRARRYDDAVQFFEKALTRDPKRVAIYFALAQALQEMKRLDEAVEVLQRGLALVEQGRGRKLLLMGLSSLQQQQKRYMESVKALREAYDLDRTDMVTFFRLANLLFTVEDKAAYDVLIAEGRKTFRNSEDEFRQTLAALLMDFHRYGDALPEYEALRAQHRDRWQLYAQISTIYQRLRQPANGEKLLAEARDALSDNSPDFNRFVARYYTARYDHEKAYQASLRLLNQLEVPKTNEAAEERFTLYRSMFYNLGRLKKADEIAKLLERAQRELGSLDPKEMRSLRAHALVEAKRYDEAIALFRQMTKEEPDDPELYYETGAALNEAKRSEESEASLRKALGMLPRVPSNPEERELRATVLNHLGYLFAEENRNLDEAKRFLTEALDLLPRASHIEDSMGWVEFRLGQTDKALALIRKAMDGSSEDPILYDHLADVYAKMGDKEKAVENWRAALKLDSGLSEIKAKIEKAGKK